MSPARAASRPAAALKRACHGPWLKTADPDFEDRFKALLAAEARAGRPT